MVSLNELNDAFGDLNFIKCCYKSDNTYFNYGFQTLLWRLVHTMPQDFSLQTFWFWNSFWCFLITEYGIDSPVVAYHKIYLPIFDNISYRKFNVIFKTELLGQISITYLSMHPVNANLPSKWMICANAEVTNKTI